MTAPETVIEWLARIVTALVALLGGWLWNRIGKIEDKVNAVELTQAKDYVTRAELADSVARIEHKIDKLGDQLAGKADK